MSKIVWFAVHFCGCIELTHRIVFDSVSASAVFDSLSEPAAFKSKFNRDGPSLELVVVDEDTDASLLFVSSSLSSKGGNVGSETATLRPLAPEFEVSSSLSSKSSSKLDAVVGPAPPPAPPPKPPLSRSGPIVLNSIWTIPCIFCSIIYRCKTGRFLVFCLFVGVG